MKTEVCIVHGEIRYRPVYECASCGVKMAGDTLSYGFYFDLDITKLPAPAYAIPSVWAAFGQGHYKCNNCLTKGLR